MLGCRLEVVNGGAELSDQRRGYRFIRITK